MSITAQRVRELVAALANAEEGAHHGHPDFRVNKRIFATLSEAEDRAALRLTSVEARALAERTPEVFRLVSDREPVTWVSVLLASADEPEFSDLLEEAWSLRVNEKPAARARPRRSR
jgi:predicted DNA-binding protein (MmcQ/YjbR family)